MTSCFKDTGERAHEGSISERAAATAPATITNKITFAVGDTVYLKSGSPKMVITAIDAAAETVSVAWNLYQTIDINRDTFPAACMKKA